MRSSEFGKWSRRKQIKLLRENAKLKAQLSFPNFPRVIVSQHPVREFKSAVRCGGWNVAKESWIRQEIARDLVKSLLEHGAIEFKEEPEYQLCLPTFANFVPMTVIGRVRVVMPEETNYAR